MNYTTLEDIDAVAIAASHLMITKYLQLASVVMLIYDHAITLGTEIERVWKQSWSFVTILFAINRYVSPLQLTVAVVAFNLPSWSENNVACDHFVRYLGGGTVGLVGIAEIILILRVYALWSRDLRILGILLSSLALQVGIQGWVLSHSIRTPLPPGFVGCILTGSGAKTTVFWAIPLLTDILILFLTLLRTGLLRGTRSALIQLFVRDGVVYFVCILVSNCFNVFVFLAAPPDLKAMGATLSQCVTATMISRLVINLRSFRERGGEDSPFTVTLPHIPSNFSNHRDARRNSQAFWNGGAGHLYLPGTPSFIAAMMSDESTYHTFLGNMGGGVRFGSESSTRGSQSRPSIPRRDGCDLGLEDDATQVEVGMDSEFDIPLTPTGGDKSSKSQGANAPRKTDGHDYNMSIDSGYQNSGVSTTV